MRPIASTAAPVETCTAAIWPAISSVALAVCTASDFTSDATTAKPRPASPARAASMVALSASRLVCPATSWISLTTSPIFCADCASEPICSLVDPASVTAVLTTVLVWLSCRLISAIDADSSSAAPAAISTFIDASFEVSTAPSARCEALLDAANSVEAVDAHRHGVLADRLQHGLDARTEHRDRRLHGGAALLLRRHQVAFLVVRAAAR